MLATALAAVAMAVSLLGLVARYLPVDGHVVLGLTAASPYLMAVGPVGMLLFGLAQRWVLALLAACLCVVLVGVQAPRYLGPETIAVPAITVRVMTANLGMGQADSRALAALASESADVLVVQEMTQEAAAGLSSAGLDGVFAHRVIDPRPLASGIGVWSRYPIVKSGGQEGFSLPLLWARLAVPGVVADPTVVAVHLAAPWPQPIEDWRRDIARFAVTLRELADNAGAGAVIAAGDLNATIDMVPFRRLLDEGYRDAAEQAGAGLTRTYPNGRWRPPMLGIDHVLVYGSAATSARTVALPGSDHRGLVATVDIPMDPTAS